MYKGKGLQDLLLVTALLHTVDAFHVLLEVDKQ
jgi:hypothetical protein